MKQKSGGSKGINQHWTAAKWESATLVWTLMNEPLGIGCNVRQLSTQGCAISTTSHSGFGTWDTHLP